MRIALYSHDTMGLGHTRRNLLIASILAQNIDDADILLIAGAHTINQFSLPNHVDCVTLPALYKNEMGTYQAKSLRLGLNEIRSLRSSMIATAVRHFQPDLFIADKVPLGALNELEPALKELQVSKARCVLGVRDILDEPEVVQREWLSAENLHAIETYYDEIWIYGDPAVYDLAQDCHFPQSFANKLKYVGYLNPLSPIALKGLKSSQKDMTLCLLGGGQDGMRLAEAFVTTPLDTGEKGLLVTGPYLPKALLSSLQEKVSERSDMHLLEFTAEPLKLLQQAKRVIAMGGYNTVTELLAAKVPALIVPRVSPRSEQLIRAERLSHLGLISYLHPDELSPERLSAWLQQTPSPLKRYPLRMIGAANIIRLTNRLLQLPSIQPTIPTVSTGDYNVALSY